MPARRKSVVRDDQKPGKQRKGLHNRDKKVTMKAAQKSVEDIASRHSRRFKSEKEDNAKDEPDDNEEKAPKGREAVAGTGPVDWRRGLLAHLKPRI